MLIDTNIYSALDAGDQQASLAIKDASIIYLPIIVVAELKYGFKNGNNQAANERNLIKFLSLPTVEVLYVSDRTAAMYAELAIFCRKRGRAISQNDLWIAALAQEFEEKLTTYDKDFSVFKDVLKAGLVVPGSLH